MADPTTDPPTPRIAILGGGNIGLAIARGLVACGDVCARDIVITRRNAAALAAYREEGFSVAARNAEAIAGARIVLLCVQPAQILELARELASQLDAKRQLLVSVATGVSSTELREAAGGAVTVVRAMPNTAIAVGESMTCVAADGASEDAIAEACRLFDAVGETAVIEESQMTEATALCACGVAFFLRAVRAASQGGIEIGFHADDAIAMAAQTARGAASLLLRDGRHPEREIDRVTTPMGCTIAGLNRMEHEGFSSALIRGIVTSARQAARLGHRDDGQ